MASTTSIPAVIDALIAALEASADLDGVQIVDGQPTSNMTLRPDVIVVGWSPERPATESTQERQNLRATRDRESYDLVVLVSSMSGDRAMKPVRDRCAELVDGVNAALVADRRLGGACLQAQMTTNDLAQVQTDKGPSATAEVLISVTALTRS